tara:strand:+ start:1565 stop:3145 length:1581 start_codon:yes stop_codon:yes gene_type:complete
MDIKTILFLKKYSFFLVWIFINAFLTYINIYYFPYLYMIILIHGPLSKFFLLLPIIYYKIKDKYIKKKRKIKNYLNDLISITVTCYCESFEEIFLTVQSLDKSFEKSEKNSILFIIFDGLSKEKGTDEYTWQILMKHMEIFKYEENIEYNENWKELPIIIDLISGKYNNLNIILVIKHTNLGKKDSLNFVRDYSVDLLEKNITNKISYLLEDFNIQQNQLKLVGSMDADCVVNEDGIYHLYNDIQYENMIGVSGFVIPKREQKKGMWYMIQLLEYYNTQYLTRLSFSYLGQTTCLPGALNIFDMSFYNKKIRDKFQTVPCKSNMFESLVALIGEDRRFTGLSLYYNKNCYTTVNENVIINTTVPNSFRKYRTQRRRWITSSLLNNYNDLYENIHWGIKYNSFATLLFFYLLLYIMTINIYLWFNINNTVIYYRYIIYGIFLSFLFYQLHLLFNKMKFNSDRLHYIIGFILFILFFPFIGIYLVFYCLFNLDNLRWGNIKQNIVEENNNEIILEEIECDKVEVVIIE